MELFDTKIKDLVAAIDDSAPADASLDRNLIELVGELRHRCALPEIQARYEQYGQFPSRLERFPLDAEGYAEAIDPIVNEAEFYERWQRYGIVVGDNALSPELCEATIRRIEEIAARLSEGRCDLTDPVTFANIPVDKDGTPLLSRGFFEIYHDDALAQIRQSVHIYLHHVLLWGKAELWSSFDRLGVKLPGHVESGALPLHVDQNPLVHADFKTVQGVLALSDCPERRGTYVGVPGSKAFFHEYDWMAGQGEYVELNSESALHDLMTKHAQVLPIRAGDLVSWDSRTTHCNSANVSGEMRVVAYTAMGPVPHNEEAAMMPRREAFRTGLGSNVRESLMHASKPPRYTDQAAVNSVRASERLNALGKLVYGESSYSSVD